MKNEKKDAYAHRAHRLKHMEGYGSEKASPKDNEKLHEAHAQHMDSVNDGMHTSGKINQDIASLTNPGKKAAAYGSIVDAPDEKHGIASKKENDQGMKRMLSEPSDAQAEHEENEEQR